MCRRLPRSIVVFALSAPAALALSACNSDSTTVPNGRHVPMARPTTPNAPSMPSDAGGMDFVATSDTGNCPEGTQSTRAVVAYMLDAAGLHARPVASIDTSAEPLALELSARLLPHADGMLVVTGEADGFWDVATGAEPVWLATDGDGEVVDLLSPDLDGDGDQDAVVLHQGGNPVGTQVSIWERSASGLQRRGSVKPRADSWPVPLAAADVDGDATIDLVALEPTGPVVLRGDGAFGFERTSAGPGLDSELNARAIALSLQDADGDGSDDLLAVYRPTQFGVMQAFVVIHPGDGHGSFGSPIMSVVEGEITGATVFRDATGDGLLDVALIRNGPPRTQVLLVAGEPSGAFGAASTILELEGDVRGLLMADVDGDAVYEVVTAHGDALHVATSTTSGSSPSLGVQAFPLALGELGAISVPSPAGGDTEIYALLGLGCAPACDDACSGDCSFGRCFGCTDDAACGDDHCRGGRCVQCTTDADCAEGERCTGFSCIRSLSTQGDWAAVALAAGSDTGAGCGLDTAGELRCFGEGWGELPSGPFTSVAITALDTEDIAGVGCAIEESGELACWPGVEGAEVPEPPAGPFVQIAAGGSELCGVREDGSAQCWGLHGEVEQPPAGRYRMISVGGKHRCALTQGGEVTCWGCDGPMLDPRTDQSWGNESTVEGCRANYGQSDVPAGSYVAVAAGQNHTCAIERDSGALRCVGRDLDGQATPPDGAFTAVVASDQATCAIAEDGSVACFGASPWTPLGTEFTTLSMAEWRVCGVRSDGRLECSELVPP